MKSWYFKVKGEGKFFNEEIKIFGFYVDILFTTKYELKSALNLIKNDLDKSNLKIDSFVYEGEFDSFEWDANVHHEVFNALEESKLKPEQIIYTTFHCWDK